MDSQVLKSFQYIVKSVEDLSTEFGPKQHSLVLYNRLLAKTKITHTDSIMKHNQAFFDFFLKNEDAVLKKDTSLLKDPVIMYSKKVNIKIDEIFKMADNETTQIIWKHLLVIMNNVNPNAKSMELLKKSLEEKSNEGEFLNNLVQKIEKSVDPNTTDPMAAIMGMMSNGVFTDLISSMNNGMQNGSLDIGKLFGTVQGMMGSLGAMPGMTEMSSAMTSPQAMVPNTSSSSSTGTD